MVTVCHGQTLMAPAYEQGKVDAFLPSLLSSAITFLLTQSPIEYDRAGVKALIRLLKNLRDVNSLTLKIGSTYDGADSALLLQCNR